MSDVLPGEAKWEVGDDFVLPRLDDIVGGGEVEHRTVESTSAYFDTADGDLLAHGMLLRRRDGDHDADWRLRVPEADAGVEIRSMRSDAVPSEMSSLLTGVSLGKQLLNVATIHTVRDRYRITQPESARLLAEIADDHVRATVHERTEEPVRWREVAIEVGPVPRTLVKRLASVGAEPSPYPSKLARVAAMSWNERRRPGQHGKAAKALARYTSAQIEEIFQGDVGLRRRQDPIHDTRVAIRRLRSTLRVFGKLLDRSAIEGVEEELKWFSGLIGDVRDCQVQRNRFGAALKGLPPELVLGPVASRIDNELRSIQQPARELVTAAMDSPRYLELLKTLRRWSTEPPVGKQVCTKALRKRARRAGRKADRRLDAGITAGDDTLLHRARKAAKRARYAGELVGPVDGGRAKKTIKRYKKIQRVLGDHQDSVVASGTLWRLGTKAGTTAGENGFTYGLLYANELRDAAAARRAARELA